MSRSKHRTRIVLGGAMHGKRVAVLHGAEMKSMSDGTIYRKHGLFWWVPVSDTHEDAIARVKRHQGDTVTRELRADR